MQFRSGVPAKDSAHAPRLRAAYRAMSRTELSFVLALLEGTKSIQRVHLDMKGKAGKPGKGANSLT